MAFFQVTDKNNVTYNLSDYVAKGGLKVDYETLVADTSGRNAQGDMTIDVINHKYKVGVTFIPLPPGSTATEGTAAYIMNAIKDYVVTIDFIDPRTGSLTTGISAYTSTPSITWDTLATGVQRSNKFTINFIQL